MLIPFLEKPMSDRLRPAERGTTKKSRCEADATTTQCLTLSRRSFAAPCRRGCAHHRQLHLRAAPRCTVAEIPDCRRSAFARREAQPDGADAADPRGQTGFLRTRGSPLTARHARPQARERSSSAVRNCRCRGYGINMGIGMPGGLPCAAMGGAAGEVPRRSRTRRTIRTPAVCRIRSCVCTACRTCRSSSRCPAFS